MTPTTLVVLLGPIASGKSTLAAALARVLPSCEVLDLDDVFFAAPSDGWAAARAVHASLVAASGAEVVIAHGPLLLDELPTCGRRVVVSLTTTYDVALSRVTADDTRLFSKDPVFLRRTYDEFIAQPADVVIDTTTTSVEEAVAQVAACLTA